MIRISTLCESNLKVPLRRLPFDSLKLCNVVGGWAQTAQTETLTGSVKAFWGGCFKGRGCRDEAMLSQGFFLSLSSVVDLERWPESSEESAPPVQKEITRWWKERDQKRERGGRGEKGKRGGSLKGHRLTCSKWQ